MKAALINDLESLYEANDLPVEVVAPLDTVEEEVPTAVSPRSKSVKRRVRFPWGKEKDIVEERVEEQVLDRQVEKDESLRSSAPVEMGVVSEFEAKKKSIQQVNEVCFIKLVFSDAHIHSN